MIRNITIHNLISNLFLFVILLVFCVTFLPIPAAFNKNDLIGIQFVLIGLISAIGIILSNNQYRFSAGMIVWLFCFAFFFCGGLSQYGKNAFRWGLEPTNQEIMFANNLILLWMTVFAVFRNLKVKHFTIRRKQSLLDRSINIHNKVLLPLAIVLFLIGMANVVTVGWKSLFTRADYGYGIFSSIGSQPLRLLATAVTRGFSFWITLLSIYNCKNNNLGCRRVFLILMLIVSFLNIPPLGVARYIFAAYYGGICIYSFRWLRNRYVLFYVLSLGLLLLFPLLNAFRGAYTKTISLSSVIQSIGNISDNFATADYDAYTMLVYTIRNAASYGTSHGKQLLGVLLFFIPSSVWPGKPIGSGATVFHNLGLTETYNANVSCPLVAEGFINFGVFGVFVFAMFLGIITGTMDRLYWNQWSGNKTFGELFYAFSVLYFVFLCRGDLLSSFAFFCGYLITLFTIILLFNHHRSKIKVILNLDRSTMSIQ